MTNKTKLIIAALLSVALMGCGGVTEDRGGGFDMAIGKADVTRDVEHVVVYRNVEGAPNLFIACVAGHAWVTTSSAVRVDIEPAPMYNAECDGKTVEGQPTYP